MSPALEVDSLPTEPPGKPEDRMKVKVAQPCPTLCDPMDYTVHGILQARTLAWVAFPFSNVTSRPRDWTQVSVSLTMSLHWLPSSYGVQGQVLIKICKSLACLGSHYLFDWIFYFPPCSHRSGHCSLVSFSNQPGILLSQGSCTSCSLWPEPTLCR